MRRLLLVWFGLVLVVLVYLTVLASSQENVITALSRLWPDLWFRATLADAYLGFIAVFVWIAYRERTWTARTLWLLLLLCLGNIAIAGYFLFALARLGPGNSIDGLFTKGGA